MAGGIITTGNNPSLLVPGIKVIFSSANDIYPSEWPMLLDKVTSDRQYEEYVEDIDFGLAAIKTQAGAYTTDADGQGYVVRLTNVAYGLMYSITHEAKVDNLYLKVAGGRATKLARSMAMTKDIVAASVYNNAFTKNTGGDGVSMINVAHPTVSGGLQSNQLAVGIDLCEAGIEDMVIQIQGALSARGTLARVMPKTLLIHRQYQFVAERIFKSLNREGTANNDINAIRSRGAIPGGFEVSQYFTNPGAWFIRTNIPVGEGMIMQDREPVTFKAWNDDKTDNEEHSAYMRFAVGNANWRAVFGVNGP